MGDPEEAMTHTRTEERRFSLSEDECWVSCEWAGVWLTAANS